MNDNFQRAQYQNNNFDNYSRVKKDKEANGIGIAGFVLSIVSVVVSLNSLFSIVFWILGIIFSIIGLFQKPKGFAIAGTIISVISGLLFILMIIFAFAIFYSIK
ncbi:hypothetical protein [Apilactobacillus timberlakei]|uniref:hypothetical protein n=1 Tax=Apilactobacillus timberlakei TaxID=2008380 RepID=UPI001125F2E8|nr:hypothetical protein [Apilactobacillus timberlakei]TPR18099.1 hypothetical protein DYZ95_02020 [Apilactobacillus timberlakei]